MRVLLGPFLPSGSGIAGYIQGLAFALKAAGVDVTILGHGVPVPLTQEFQIVEIPDDPSWSAWFGGPIVENAIVRAWMRRLTIEIYDVIHFATPTAVFCPKEELTISCSVFSHQDMSSIIECVPKTESWWRIPQYMMGWAQYDYLDRRGQRLSNCIVLTNQSAREQVWRNISLLPEKVVEYIPPCYARPDHITLDLTGSDRLRLLFAERQLSRPRNNLASLLTALALLQSRELRHIELTLAGRGLSPVHSRMVDLLRRNGLTVELAGFVSKPVYDRILRSTDVFASLRDIREQASFGAIEATAWGLALLTAEARAYLDIVEPGVSGIMIDPRDTDSIARAIRGMIGNRPGVVSMRKNALRSWQNRFSPNVVGPMLRDAFARAGKHV